MNSDDDDPDDSAIDLFDTENVVVCQFDKVSLMKFIKRVNVERSTRASGTGVTATLASTAVASSLPPCSTCRSTP